MDLGLGVIITLMQIQQEKKEKEITDIIQTMIDEQKRLLNEGLDISKDGDIVKVKKEWNDGILTDGLEKNFDIACIEAAIKKAAIAADKEINDFDDII